FPFWGSLDRGWALERSIAKQAKIDDITLEKLADAAGRGLPALIFNATSNERGEPVVFSNTEFPNNEQEPAQSLKDPLLAFRNLDDRLDVHVETAVRMSATFPYVSPSARSSTLTKGMDHLSDGGYYDNYGMTALNAWVREGIGDSRILARES